jgi:hypothetical protein
MRGVFLRNVLLLSGTGLIAAAPVALAQNDCLKDYRMPAVGSWAEYQGEFDKKPSTIRYAVVGEETRAGTKMKWLEMRMTGETPDKTLVYQALTPGNPAEMDQIQEIVFKPGNKPAMKMNGMMMNMIRGQLGKNSALNNLCEGVTLAGEESVTVPAGTFKATRFHDAKHETDSWVTQEVPFYMVRSKGKKFELNLVKSGEGATSSITEKPQEMGGPSK